MIESIENGKLSLSCLDILNLNTHTASQVNLKEFKSIKANLKINILAVNFIYDLLDVVGSNNKTCSL